MRKKLFLIRCMCTVLMLAGAFAVQARTDDGLPSNPEVRIGKLDNGLTYYLCRNLKPENRIDFYLAQKVGSIQEDDNQRGLAHFLEHMCFNGTRHFPGNGIREYLEKIGVNFGADLNAYTSIDQTVYNICNVPSGTPGAIDSCLLILRDWCDGLSLEPEGIDKERGVIQEEWRTRMDATQRFVEKMLPVVYKGTPYANSFPIGSMEVVMNFPYQRLRDYYKKWYRPDLQGVIVVGDIDVDAVENRIKELFADMPAQPDAAPRIYYPVPDNKAPIIFTYKDKEQTYVSASFYRKLEAVPDGEKDSPDYLRGQYVANMVGSMLNQRLDELTKKPDPPYQGAAAGKGSFLMSRTKDAFGLAIGCNEDSILGSMSAALREVERARRYGFTATEYERARTNFLRGWEAYYAERDNRENNSFVQEYLGAFLNGEPTMGIENSWNIYRQLAMSVGVDEVNRQLAAWLGSDGRNLVVIVQAPDKEGLHLPDEAAIEAVMGQVRQEKLAPYEDTAYDTQLMERPQGGTIVKEEHDTLFDADVLTLGNGIRVILKQTDFKDDQILMRCIRPGGMTLVPDSLIPELLCMGAVGVGGLGKFDQTALQKARTGKNASVGGYMDDRTEIMDGACSPKDFETMMQLMYLTMTDVRRDTTAYMAYEDRMREGLLNQEMDPYTELNDSINSIVYLNHPFRKRMTADMLDHVDYDRILQLFKNFFGNAEGFTFVFVGNTGGEQIRPLIVSYIGSLPTWKWERKMVDGGVSMRDGKYECSFVRPQEVAKSVNVITYHGLCPFTLRNNVLMDMACQLLDITLMKEVREEQSGTYHIQARGSVWQHPEEMAYMQIYFETSPEKRDRLMKTTYDEMERMAKEGPSQADLDKVKEYMIKSREDALKDNSSWLSWITAWLRTGIDSLHGFEDTVRAVTPQDVAAFLHDMLEQGNKIEITMTSPGKGQDRKTN